MAILNIQTETTGQAGQIPKFIYINTNSTLAQVSAPGFLNGVVAQGQGFTFSTIDMVLIATKEHPSDPSSQLNLFTLDYTGGLWSLIPYLPGFDPSLNYTTTGNWTNFGNWDFEGNISIGSLGPPPIGSEFVVWDPIGKKLYQGGVATDFVWNNVLGASQAIQIQNGYVDSSVVTTNYTLPAIAPFGSTFEIVGRSGTGWILNQNAGQVVRVGIISTTVGVGGSVASTETYDCIRCLCTVANTEFIVISSIGNFLVT